MKIDHLLARLFPQEVKVKAFTTLKGEASNRRYHRVVFEDGVEPSSLIVMELSEDALKSEELTVGELPTELPFLNVGRYLAQAKLPTPKILLDAVNEGAVLLEDLGDLTFAGCVSGGNGEQMECWYMAAVDLMTGMHDVMWPPPAGCLAKDRIFDYNLLRSELDHYREWGNEALLEKTLDAETRKRLDKEFDILARDIAELPIGFVHRDYQSRNLMVTGTTPSPSSLSIIDFQDALCGPRIYDLVALLNDSYVDLSHDLQLKLVARYAANRGLNEADVRREFDLITIQRKLKDGGRFIFIDRVKGNPSFLPFVDKSFSRVRAALSRLSGYDNLKAVLSEADSERF